MATVYTPAPVEDTGMTMRVAATFRAHETSGAQPQQTTVAYPIVG